MLGLSLECGAFFAGLSFMGSKNLEITLTTIECLDHLFGSIFFACIGMIINPVKFPPCTKKLAYHFISLSCSIMQ